MRYSSRLATIILIVIVLITAWLTNTLVTSLRAASADTLTVCVEGPPTCDYQTVQAAVDAAVSGDKVLISSGTYTGQIRLKSNVRLESSDGADATTLTAVSGPIISAGNVVSVTIDGITIDGRDTVSTGLKGMNSELVLSHSVIQNLRGADGEDGRPDGEKAVAIMVTGTSKVTVANSIIQDIAGGDGLLDSGATGGEAAGIVMEGEGRAAIEATKIRKLSGGAAGTHITWPYGCEGTGGAVVGISTSGDIEMIVTHTEIAGLKSGAPCQAYASFCIERAGAATGIQARGGTAVLRDNLIADFSIIAAHESEPSYGVYTTNTTRTALQGNTIASLATVHLDEPPARLHSPQSPFCVPPPALVTGIMSENDLFLQVKDSRLTDLSGLGVGGHATAIEVHDTRVIRLSRNDITDIVGGSASYITPRPVAGIRIDTAVSAHIDGNNLGRIRGSDAPHQFYYMFAGVDGGSATGIRMNGVGQATVANNTIWSLAGGHGTDMDYGGYVLTNDGGNASAIFVSDSAADIYNNTLYRTVAGRGGSGEIPGQPGSAVGLYLGDNTETVATNNALIGHGIGVSAMASAKALVDYSAFWGNQSDYLNVPPGQNDLSAAPAFVAPGSGDFHLQLDSPLIDAGSNDHAPDQDFEAEPRPLDGNEDGTAVTDIGADEFWLGLTGSTMAVDAFAKPGDVLTYHLTLVNPSHFVDLAGVRLTDTIPSFTTYISGSLSASSGDWYYTDGEITWQGTITAETTVSLTFNAVIDGDLAGPHAIVNQAILDDQIGVEHILKGTTLVNPLKNYLPLVSLAPP